MFRLKQMNKMVVDNYFFYLYFILQQLFILDRVYGFGITELKVPVLVDPRNSLTLGCTYDMGSEELYSAKWYKDEEEFFRYTPRQQPHIMSFPAAGVHLAQPGTDRVQCDEHHCNVELTGLSTAHSSGAYKCEVSTEAPKFRRDIRVAKVMVAAIGRAAPVVEGVRATYSVDELVQAQCTAAAADPQPSLTWLLNGAPASATTTGPQRTSLPDQHGLVTATRDLRFHAERKHFLQPDNKLQVVCVASPPSGVPVPPLTSQTVTTRLYDPTNQQQQRNVFGNQKLEWLNDKAMSAREMKSGKRSHEYIAITEIFKNSRLYNND